MLRVFFDINAVITFLLQQPKSDDSSYLPQINDIWEANAKGKIIGCIASFSLPIIFGHCETYYYAQSRQTNWRVARQQARAMAYSDVRRCIDLLISYDLIYDHLLEADSLWDENPSCNDFEDNLQLVCAYKAGADIILTDNVRDFGCAKLYEIEVLTSASLIKRIAESPSEPK